MNSETIYFEQLEELIESFPPDTILSRTIYQDDSIKTILFGFHPGQELSEHTAAVPALLHIIKGEAHLILGEDEKTAQAGTLGAYPSAPSSQHPGEDRNSDAVVFIVR